MKSAAPRATTDKAATPAAGKGTAMVDNRAVAVAQRQMQEAIDNSPRQMAQRQQAEAVAPRKNTTGLPDDLKAGVENLSGYSLDDVKVHYNSAKPAQLQAHAYAQGTDIHVAPGQEQHLPHEAWHVVQQKQGRVKATRQLKGGVNVNDSAGLEKEADVQGRLAIRGNQEHEINYGLLKAYNGQINSIQMYIIDDDEIRWSDDDTIAVTDNTLYAQDGMAAAANASLLAVGSGIELLQQDEFLAGYADMHSILLRNNQNQTEGADMQLFSDCGRANGVVMGSEVRHAITTDGLTFSGVELPGMAGASGFPDAMKISLLHSFMNARLDGDDIEQEETAAINNIFAQSTIMRGQLGALNRQENTGAYDALLQDLSDLYAINYSDTYEDEETNEHAIPTVGQGYVISSGGAAIPDNQAWNFHWGGVIMSTNNNSDKVVLENYADPAEEENGAWEIAMYGTIRTEETFHHIHRTTNLHRTTPTTMVVARAAPIGNAEAIGLADDDFMGAEAIGLADDDFVNGFLI